MTMTAFVEVDEQTIPCNVIYPYAAPRVTIYGPPGSVVELIHSSRANLRLHLLSLWGFASGATFSLITTNGLRAQATVIRQYGWELEAVISDEEAKKL
jgi:hypothetical protein